MKCYISRIQFRNIEKSFLLSTSDYSLVAREITHAAATKLVEEFQIYIN